MQEDIRYILKSLEIKSSSVELFNKELIEALNDPFKLMEYASRLNKEIHFTKDTPEDRIPFYDFFLAIAQQKNNLGKAKESLSKAVNDFWIRDLAINQALGEWVFSIFHFENGNSERAERACETAIDIMRKLITRYEEEHRYEKTKETREHLSRLLDFQKTIIGQSTLENVQVETERTGASDLIDPLSDPPIELLPLKARLQAIHDELQKRYNELKENKQRIPVTLIAALFYLYRIITPAHSVYRTVPNPKTQREKEVYDGLIEKVGFFEVIEQLVELEREFTPTASREEILKKINFEWDQEINQ